MKRKRNAQKEIFLSNPLEKLRILLSLSLSLSLKRIGRSDARQRRRLGVKETPGKRCCCWHRRRHRLSRKKSARLAGSDFQTTTLRSRAKSGSRGGEEKTMTEDRNQTLADALEELGFRGHVPKQWVPMVAEVRRARLLSILRPGVAVECFGFWIFVPKRDVWRDECLSSKNAKKRKTEKGERREAPERYFTTTDGIARFPLSPRRSKLTLMLFLFM